MVEGALALLTFLLVLVEWPSFIRWMEGHSSSKPGWAATQMRLARWREGEDPWHDDFP